MNFTVKTLGICAVLAGALAAGMPATAATTLRIGTVLAPNDPMGQGLEKFKLDVEKPPMVKWLSRFSTIRSLATPPR